MRQTFQLQRKYNGTFTKRHSTRKSSSVATSIRTSYKFKSVFDHYITRLLPIGKYNI